VTLPAPTVVLMYHRVASPERDIHDLSVQPARFAAQMRHLHEHEEVVPLVEARRPSRRRRVVVTFDDGYADNAYAAREILEELALPATYFVTARYVDGELTPWWDELGRSCSTAARPTAGSRSSSTVSASPPTSDPTRRANGRMPRCTVGSAGSAGP
jgi:peptidoglycan/xylan/chitin deacetylase (PgdA/CDA1 family)